MRALWIILPLLAACVDAPGSSSGPGQIEIMTGSLIGGSNAITVLSDESYTQSSSGPMGSTGQTSGSFQPGAYARARAILEARVPDLENLGRGDVCAPDKPRYTIRFEPAIKRISSLTQCNGREVARLISDVRSALAE